MGLSTVSTYQLRIGHVLQGIWLIGHDLAHEAVWNWAVLVSPAQGSRISCLRWEPVAGRRPKNKLDG